MRNASTRKSGIYPTRKKTITALPLSSMILILCIGSVCVLILAGGARVANATTCNAQYYYGLGDYSSGGYYSYGVKGLVYLDGWTFYNGHLLKFLDMELTSPPGTYWMQSGAGEGTVSGHTSSGRQIYFEYNLPSPVGYFVWFGGTAYEWEGATVQVYDQSYNSQTGQWTWALGYTGVDSYSTHVYTTYTATGLAVAVTESETFTSGSTCNAVVENLQSSLQYESSSPGGSFYAWPSLSLCAPVSCVSPYHAVDVTSNEMYEYGS